MTIKEHLLLCLAEECMEVGQRVSKSLRFGLGEIQAGQNKTNEERIAQEFNDLLGAYTLLRREGILNVPLNEVAVNTKIEKILQYLSYAADQGTISDC